MPLDAFIERSIESAPSALEQGQEFSQILQSHIQNGAQPAEVVRVVQDALTRFSGNDTDRAAAQWACQIMAQSVQQTTNGGGYQPSAMQNGGGGGGGGAWETQKHHNQQRPSSNNTDIYVRSYFFPSEESFESLIVFLDSAKDTLDICVFNITDNDLARAIGNAKQRGVEVRIITDDEQLKCRGNDVERLEGQYGIPFKTDNDPDKFMHSKFAVIDKRSVWAGSFNWTVSARRYNNESVICTNDPKTAKAFSNEFEKLWSQF